MPIVEKVEIWKKPPSIQCDWLEVSHLGRCRTLPHFSPNGNVRAGRILSLSPDTRGRPLLTFFFKGKQHNRLLRCIVAECFLPEWKKGKCVFHKNGDVTDCRAENLIVGTQKTRYSIATISKSKHIIIVEKDGKVLGRFFGIRSAGRYLGVSKQAVHYAVRRQRPNPKGLDLSVRA